MRATLLHSSTARTTGGLLAIMLLPIIIWPGLVRNLFATDFMPHIYCLSQQPSLVALNVIANLLIGAAYVVISGTLAYFVYKKRSLPFHWMFLAFGAFIIACGTTHFMDVWTLWHPTYWLSGSVSLITAVMSVTTAFLLPPLIPKALALPSPSDLLRANQELEREIVEHECAEAALRESEARYRAVVEQSSEGIYLFDAQTGAILESNGTFLALLSYKAEEIVRLTIYDIMAGEREAIDHSVQRILKKPILPPSLRQYRRHDGSLVDVEISANPIFPDREIVCVAVRDVTERKRAEEALKEQAMTLREQANLLDLTHDTIMVRQLDGTIVYWNRGAEEMYGWTKEEAVGKVSHDLLDTEFPLPWEEIKAVLIREGRWEGELKHRHRDGTRLIVSSRWAMHYNEQGYPLAALEINSDISERVRIDEEVKELNVALNQYARQLETANQELEAFSYSVSHDLRAPLRAMSGFARILLEDHTAELSADAQECAQIIETNAQQMGELIDDLLVFSRLSRQPLKKQTVVPGDLAHALVDEMQGQQNGRRIRFVIDEMPVCQADPTLLKQVYANLIGNAVKYTRQRDAAIIEVGCLSEPENGGPVYFVKDNGVGFDMRYAHKLFGVFQRLHSAEEYEGTGVGLALVQRIVHRHGGRVWAEAQPNQGATFHFTLEGGTDDRTYY